MSELIFQARLLEKIKEKLDPNQTLIDNVTDVLDLSRDSGYRRIRSETALSFDEALKLARHFGIPLNEILDNEDQSATFSKLPFINSLETYRGYLQKSLEQLEIIKHQRNNLMIYSAKDIPIFYQFGFRKLAAFKMYVWWKSVYDIQTIDGAYYSLKDVPEDLLDLAARQWAAYSQINTIEIWNDTTVVSLLNQIRYYYEAGLLKDKEEALELCEEFREMMKLIYKQAMTGNKIHPKNPEMQTGASCKIYYHEILLMDNHILADLGEKGAHYYIPFAGLNFIHTSDRGICYNMKEFLINQTRKSALISDASEKDRNRFFIKIRNKIDAVKEKISSADPFT